MHYTIVFFHCFHCFFFLQTTLHSSVLVGYYIIRAVLIPPIHPWLRYYTSSKVESCMQAESDSIFSSLNALTLAKFICHGCRFRFITEVEDLPVFDLYNSAGCVSK